MDILSALFVENIDLRPVEGPSTRIDLTGVMFSFVDASPLPVSVEPHLVVIVSCPADEPGTAVLETVFKDESGEQVARNIQPFQVEPGRFGYRLVRGELTYEKYGTISAHVRIDQGPWLVVPLTLLPKR